MLAGGLMVIAAAAFVGATRLGGDVDRLERAETLSFQLEARIYEQALLGSRAAGSGVQAEGAPPQRVEAVRQEIFTAVTELADLLPENPVAARIVAVAAGWQAAVETELRLLSAGDLVAANRVNRGQVDPRFRELAGELRTAGLGFDEAANAAQRRSRVGSLAVAIAAMLLSLVLLSRVERARHRQAAAERKVQEERARLVNKILSVAERQRSGMAVELHDGPIQGLTRVGLCLDRGRLRLGRGQLEEGIALLSDAQAQMTDELQALRQIMATLRPPVLEERGLVSALCDYVEMVRQQAGITFTVAADLPERLPEDQEIVLYRVAQEALTNVAQHARASQARVELAETTTGVVLEVHDDGVGFDPGAELRGGSLDHFGLAGMRERVELAGGTWTVWSRPGAGTVLTATLPRTLVAA
jgi:signal transduction histidine kinase